MVKADVGGYRKLSMMVYHVLEKIGASLDVRKLHIERSYRSEILATLVQPKFRYFIFGSTFEGTQTPNMMSDIDFALVDTEFEVSLNGLHANGKQGLLVIQDDTTPPGYVKLQIISNKRPLEWSPENDPLISTLDNTYKPFSLRTDDKRRVVITMDPDIAFDKDFRRDCGTAFKQSPNPGQVVKEFVFVFQSEGVPECASSWLEKFNCFYSLTPNDVRACKSFGCLFVQKAHRHSKDSHLLWRMSPSHQERLIVSNFNSVQHKCYVLLKLIKKDIINPAVGSETLSSYHCKTAMLFVIATTSSQFWRPYNLLFGLRASLDLLFLWSKAQNCPNFFIPSENMFKGRCSYSELKRLTVVLYRLLSSNLSFLQHIQMDQFSENLYCIFLNQSLYNAIPNLQTEMHKLRMTLTKLFCIPKCVKQIVNMCYCDNVVDTLRKLCRKLFDLQQTKRIDIHSTVKDTEDTIALLAPYIDVYRMSNIVALSVKRRDTRETTLRYLTSARWHKISLSTDSFTSILKQASLLCALGYNKVALDVLSRIENHVSYAFCNCRFEGMDAITQSIQQTDVLTCSDKEILQKFLNPCVLFLPTEINIVPFPLRVELTRSTKFKLDYFNDWGKWANVDGNFLLHFLLYFGHKNARMEFSTDIHKMEMCISGLKPLVHRETDLNILGWVYKEERKLDRAYECFKKSLIFQPDQEAAYWHLLFLLKYL